MTPEIIRQVTWIIGEHCNLNPRRKTRLRNYVECRFIIWDYLLYKCDQKVTVAQLCRYFKCDHSTICSGMDRLQELLFTDMDLLERCYKLQMITTRRLNAQKERKLKHQYEDAQQ